MLGSRYEEVLNESMAAFSSWYQNLSEDERAEQEQRARDYVEQLRREAAADDAGVRPHHRPGDGDDDWEPPTSILRKPRRR
ncbi:MAG TPA: hypothetical protein DGT23_35190 [Micromonosporaceae bacterium]|nr:hypothetical protein [Micromonosporaceae bacterium]